jgi:hypothetical protein
LTASQARPPLRLTVHLLVVVSDPRIGARKYKGDKEGDKDLRHQTNKSGLEKSLKSKRGNNDSFDTELICNFDNFVGFY